MKKYILSLLFSLLMFTANSEPVNALRSGKISNSTESGTFATTRAEEVFTYNGINYQVLDAEAKTCKTQDGGFDSDGNSVDGNKCTGDIVIPEIVFDGNVEYKVTQIGENSFYENDIISVSMPNSIEIIEPGAFWACPKLTSVRLSDNLKKIGYAAFFDNPSLKSIVFPDSCVDIDYACLYKCTSLESVKLPALLTVIESDFFRECVNLKEIEIPQGVTNIRNRAFYNCKSLTSIEIPAGIERIGFQNTTKNGYRVFEGCPFTRVTYNAEYPIPTDESNFSEEVYTNAVLVMPNATMDLIENSTPWNLFSHIEAAERVGNLTTGDIFTYNGINYQVVDAEAKTCKTKDAIHDSDGKLIASGNACSGDIVIPEIVSDGNVEYKVTQIGSRSFIDNDITSVIMPNSIEIIEYNAFLSCKKLINVQLSENLKYIGNGAFESSNIEHIILPNSVEEIGFNGFAYNDNLKTVLFPDNCSVQAACFRECTNLESVKLPSNLTGIYSNCFRDCINLREIDIPNTVKTIGSYAFLNCKSLTSIEIPAGIEEIGYQAYNAYRAFEGCPFTRITYNAEYPILTDESNFSEEVYSNAVLVMPNATMDQIKNVTPWNLFSHIEAAEDSGNLTEGDDFEYEGIKYTVLDAEERTCETKAGTFISNNNTYAPANVCSGILEIPEIAYNDTVGYKVLKIGEHSFIYNEITSLFLPNSVTNIDDGAFAGCKQLNTVRLSESLKSIGLSAFSGCESLFSIKFPDSLESIDTWGFADCGFYTIEIPESCGLDNWGIFSGCKNLTSVKLPKTLKRIYGYVFQSCENLTEINLPKGLQSIGNLCFEKCINLKKINNTESLTEIGAGAFSECESLESFVIPASIEKIGNINSVFNDSIFAKCHSLASLVWEADRQIPDNVLPEIPNPNLLLYVNDAQYAPTGFDRTLVVKDGASGNYTCRNLVVTPGNPFYAARNFTAERSSMTKEFTQETPIGGCAGWETIVLPFDATSVSVSDARGELTPFALVNDLNIQYPYWLFEADSKREWKAGFGIKAGIPYLISMPNNEDYSVRYNIDGPVTFSNPSPTLISTETTSPYTVTWDSGQQFHTLWTSLDKSEEEKAMGLNVGIDYLTDDAGQTLPAGSAFHINVKPKPLEAYLTTPSPQRAIRISGDSAGILPVIDDKGVCMTVRNGDLVLSSMFDRSMEIYTPAGVIVKRIHLKAGEQYVVSDLTPGIYIVAGHKVAVK